MSADAYRGAPGPSRTVSRRSKQLADVRVHDVFVGGEQLHQRRQERRDDALRNLLSEHRQKFERVGANHGMRATLGSLKLEKYVLVEKVDDVYQIVGFRRTLHQRLRAHRERDDQIDGRVLRLPKFFRIRRVLREERTHVPCDR